MRKISKCFGEYGRKVFGDRPLSAYIALSARRSEDLREKSVFAIFPTTNPKAIVTLIRFATGIIDSSTYERSLRHS